MMPEEPIAADAAARVAQLDRSSWPRGFRLRRSRNEARSRFFI